jgi:UDP-N-acetylmuramate dehydrogenase
MSAAAEDAMEPSLLRRDEPMRKHTSWRVGGPADWFAAPRSLEELRAVLRALPAGVPVHWVGLGSNLLVRDGGIRGAVIVTAKLAKALERLDDVRVRAGAGLPCNQLAKACARWRLGPAAFFAGIPGTVGGALAMNAGAFGGETWSHVESVVTIDRGGELHERRRDEFAIGYRSVSGPPNEWFWSGTFRFAPDPAASEASIKEMLAKRGATQPLGVPSCGSVFRNPPGDYAGRLIEQAGLKGARIGGAVVADKHANFIVNDGGATAADVEQLIELVRSTVAQRTGVRLELEARVIGEAPVEIKGGKG